jgi:hypothetical protein
MHCHILKAKSTKLLRKKSFIPDAAIGCPKAIAPPQTFTLFWSIPSSRKTATDCAAKASLNSNKSTSSLLQPAFFS